MNLQELFLIILSFIILFFNLKTGLSNLKSSDESVKHMRKFFKSNAPFKILTRLLLCLMLPIFLSILAWYGTLVSLRSPFEIVVLKGKLSGEYRAWVLALLSFSLAWGSSLVITSALSTWYRLFKSSKKNK